MMTKLKNNETEGPKRHQHTDTQIKPIKKLIAWSLKAQKV